MMKHFLYTTLRSLATSLSIALRTLFFLAVISTANTIVVAQSILDGGTPVGVAPGAPAGAYALSDLESVNLFSGNLNFTLPLMKIGGRGGAQGAIMLPIESHWTNFYFFRRQDGSYYNPIPMYNFDGGAATVKPGYGPGVLIPKSSEIVWGVNCVEGTYIDSQTRLIFIAGDGTQFELRDTVHDGSPLTRYCNQPLHSRGTTFVTKDGSAATFISDTVILDGPPPGSPVSGYLMLRDGTRYRIDNGLVTWIRDRNGNQITYSYTGNRVTLIKDSLNREITIEYAVNDIAPYGLCDRIRFKGSGGQERIIRVSYSQLSSVLASGYTLLTKNQMFPPPFPPDFISENQNTNFDTQVVSSVWLPDGERRYRFFYNGYGELARAELPTGGAFEYVWETTPLMEYDSMPQELLRRVKTRKVINGSTAEQKTSYSYTLPPTRNGTTVVTLDHSDESQPSQAFSQEKHYFYGTPIPIPFQLIQNTLFRDSPWTTGKEYQTDLLGANGTPLLRRTTQVWRQRASVSWWPAQDTAPANDPRIVETISTLADTNQVSKRTSIDPGDPSGQTVGFDQFNNPTDVWEYDFGAGAPGSFLRRSHIDYVTASNYVEADVNPTLGAHLRGLPSQKWVSSDFAGANKVSFTQYEYDNYSTDARHKPLEPRVGITGLCLRVDAAGTCIMLSGVDYQIRGNLTGVTSYANASMLAGPVTVSTQYDIAGNAIAGIDRLGKISTLGFSDSFCNGSTCGGTFTPNTYAFPSIAISPVPDPTGQNGSSTPLTTTSVYDFWTGRVTSTTDPNNQTTGFQYIDPLDRLTAVIRPTGGGRTDYEYGDTIGDLFVRTLTDLDTDLGTTRRIETRQYFDGLGRAIETRTYESTSQYIAVKQIPFIMQQDPDTEAWVQAVKTSNPFRSGEPDWTTTFLDALGRTTKVRTPDSALVRTAYSGNIVTVTDQAGKQRRSVTDGLGRLTRVDEPDKDTGQLGSTEAPVQPTCYQYDVLGNLTKVIQGTQIDPATGICALSGSQQRTFTYDSLSRLGTAMNPESGTISYSYDDNGNLLVKTDARGVSAHYGYDALNRVFRRWYNGSSASTATTHNVPALPTGVGTSSEVTYVYDAGCPTCNTKGKVISVSSSVSNYSYGGYDAMGRPGSGTQTMGAQSYTTSYTYDLAGHVKTMNYPSGNSVTYNYDNAGRLADKDVQNLAFTGNLGEGGPARTYATGISYSSLGGLQEEEFGTTTPIYHKQRFNSRGQLWDIRASTVSFASDPANGDRGAIVNYYSNNFVQGGSGADNNGNLLRQENYIPGSSFFQENFEYDHLNRLKFIAEKLNGTGNDSFKQTYSYDRYGNRRINTNPSETFGGVNNLNFDLETATNRLYALGDLALPEASRSMRYDAAGNLWKDTYTGAATGQLAIERLYDAENRMTKETQSGNYVAGEYFYDGDGRRVKRKVGGIETWQVYGIGGEVLAEYTSNGTQLSKEYGYRNGELLITATVTSGWGSPPTIQDNPLKHPQNPESFKIKALHITELRAAINALRFHYSLPNYQWVKPTTSQGAINSSVLVSWAPIDEMRTALDEALGAPSGGYAAGLAQGQPIKAIHIQELRDRVLAAWVSGGSTDIRWLITDHLGTPRMIFDQTGSLANVSRHDYLPFGEEVPGNFRTGIPGYATGDNVRQKFTSKERDIETGLDYFEARYYSSPQGRFTSVDPYDVNLERQDTDDQGEAERKFSRYVSQPQHWNHYSYVLNNPLKFIDPDGWSEEDNFTLNLLGQDVRITINKKILKQDPKALAKVKETISKAFDKINQAHKDKPFTQDQLDSIHRLDKIQVTENDGIEGMSGNTFYYQFNHATNPNIDIVSGDIMHDPRHAEQAARGIGYGEKTAIPMEMEASSFVLGIIITRGWSEESIQAFCRDSKYGHFGRGSKWKDKSTPESRQKLFDRMSAPRKK